MKLLESLDNDQKIIVKNTEGKYLVLASAGSGKTRALTSRIAYILEKKLALPHNILAVTFTNKAANEMKERIYKISSLDLKQMWIGTFHSICVKILVSNGFEIGIPNNFTILDEEDKIKELRKVLDKTYSQDDLYMHSSFISRAKEHDLYPDSNLEDFKNLGIPEETIDIYKKYHNNIRLMNSLDFDDLIMETIRLFNIKKDLLKAYATRFKYVLMDECQDSAPSHQKLILMLSSVHNNLMLIGDADQAIYGWRGADVSFTLKYAKEKDIKVLTLKNNYRSQGIIVKAADAVIEKNITRIKKTAKSIKRDGSKIVYYRPDTPYEEAIFIADIINLLIKKEFRPYSDFTVLYRTNAQARIIEETLARKNIPTTIIGQMSFYQKVEIKVALAYIKVLINPNDFINFQKIVNFPKRGLGDASLEKLVKYAIENKLNIYETIDKIDEIPRVQKIAKENVRNLINIIKDFNQYVDKIDHARLVKDFFTAVGLINSLTADELVNVQDLISSIIYWSKDVTKDRIEEKTLFKYIKEISLLMIEEEEKNTNRVKLMSIHASKGLEFPIVFIVGVEEDLFPHFSINSDQSLEEERRLFYVALTRAMDRVFITSNLERGGFGKVYKIQESRFIKEIPEEYLKRL